VIGIRIFDSHYTHGGGVKEIPESRGQSTGALSVTLSRLRKSVANCIRAEEMKPGFKLPKKFSSYPPTEECTMDESILKVLAAIKRFETGFRSPSRRLPQASRTDLPVVLLASNTVEDTHYTNSSETTSLL
jgi:hypothetical protein